MTEQSNFPIAIKAITDMADYYDSKNKPKLAEKLTTVARNLVNIKTAQFVGGQGYWVRNTRCWDNCYRQKRATDTTKTAQEVWTACHEEYLKSINDSESGWEKYAENIGTFKFAGKNMQNTIKTAAQTFHKEMTKRVKAGVEVGVAVHATIQDNIERYNNSFIDELQELTKIATYLKEHKQKKEAATLTGVANELIKEARWWNPLEWGDGQYITQIREQVTTIVDNLEKRIQQLGYHSSPQEIQQSMKELYGEITQGGQSGQLSPNNGQVSGGNVLYGIGSIIRQIKDPKLKQQATGIFTNTQSIISNLMRADTVETLYTAIRNFNNINSDIQQMEPMQQGQPDTQQPAPSTTVPMSQTPPQGGPTDVPTETAVNPPSPKRNMVDMLKGYVTNALSSKDPQVLENLHSQLNDLQVQVNSYIENAKKRIETEKPRLYTDESQPQTTSPSGWESTFPPEQAIEPAATVPPVKKKRKSSVKKNKPAAVTDKPVARNPLDGV